MMNKKEDVLEKTITKLNRLSDKELKEAHDFIDFLIHKLEDRDLTTAIQKQAEKGSSFKFLEDEQELYGVNDLQERYG